MLYPSNGSCSKTTIQSIQVLLPDEHNIKRLDWPANSPDLNPIENVWALLKGRVANRRPGNLDELELTIKQEWNALTRDYAFSLISSMPSRLKQVIERDGDAVDY